jgi:hypothetical protein
MSDTYLSFAPQDIHWTPSGDHLSDELVSMAWEAYPDAEEIEALVHEHVAFVHPIENLESTICPHCESNIHEWFWEFVDDGNYEGTEPGPLVVDLPCCGKSTSLTELKFSCPAAFAKFQLDILNPDVAEIHADDFAKIESGLHAKIEKAAGQQFVAVWTHM